MHRLFWFISRLMVLLPITLVLDLALDLLTVVASPITPYGDTEGKLAIPHSHTQTIWKIASALFWSSALE